MRLQGALPALGRRTQPCPQGTLPLHCEHVVQATPNFNFRRVTVRVSLGKGPVLAQMDGLMSRLR
jgi:general secretion pathway protein I